MTPDAPTIAPGIPIDRLLHAARARFREVVGHAPTHAAIAPGRVNLIGEHTDYNDGLVLPIAIDRWTIVMARRRNDRFVSLATDAPAMPPVLIDLRTPLQPVPTSEPQAWANGIIGLLAALIDEGADVPGLDLSCTTTLPIGAGLSSSAALLLSSLRILEDLTHQTFDDDARTHRGQRAEHDFIGTPCGIMDPTVCAGGRADHAMLLDCRSLERDFFPMPLADVIVVDTGRHHELATSEYAERRRSCEDAATRMRVPALRDATLAMVAAAGLSPTEVARASHVITENTRVVLAAQALRDGDLDTLGDLMFASHESLRELYAVSCPELDCIVDTAASLGRQTVAGARMTGGGFGGSAIMLVQPGRRNVACQAVHGAFVEAFGKAPVFRPVVAVDGATSDSATDGGHEWNPM